MIFNVTEATLVPGSSTILLLGTGIFGLARYGGELELLLEALLPCKIQSGASNGSAFLCHILPHCPRDAPDDKEDEHSLEGRSHVNTGRDDWI